jgi:hypothetical protein
MLFYSVVFVRICTHKKDIIYIKRVLPYFSFQRIDLANILPVINLVFIQFNVQPKNLDILYCSIIKRSILLLYEYIKIEYDIDLVVHVK